MPDFEMGQRVRVREDLPHDERVLRAGQGRDGGDADSIPQKRLLGKEGTIGLAARIRLGYARGCCVVGAGWQTGPHPTAYYVEFDDGESVLITATWLEPTEAPGE